jgi:hypothetical protein
MDRIGSVFFFAKSAGTPGQHNASSVHIESIKKVLLMLFYHIVILLLEFWIYDTRLMRHCQ